jgi:hypothetical protein
VVNAAVSLESLEVWMHTSAVNIQSKQYVLDCLNHKDVDKRLFISHS